MSAARRPAILAIMPPGATMRGLKSQRELRVGDQIEEDDGDIEVEYVGPAGAKLGYEWRLSGSPEPAGDVHAPPAVRVDV